MRGSFSTAPVLALALITAALLGGCGTFKAETEFATALTAFKAGDFVTAERHAAAARDLAPKVGKNAALLGWAKLKREDLAGATEVLRQLRSDLPDYVETRQLEGWLAYTQGDLPKANRAFLAQQDWAARIRRSEGYPTAYMTKDITFIENIHADAGHGLGLVALAEGRDKEGRALLKRASEVATYDGRHLALAALTGQGRPAAAAVIVPAIDCGTRLRGAWAAHDGGDEAGAAAAFAETRAVRCPQEAEAMMGEGIARLGLGQFDVADALLLGATTLAPDNVRAQVARGGIAHLRGNFPEAIQIYRHYYNRLPRHEAVWSWGSHALNNLGWSYYRTGDLKAARTVFKRLADYHRPGVYAAPLAGLGWTALAGERREEARGHFQAALKLAPDYPLAVQGMETLVGRPAAVR